MSAACSAAPALYERIRRAQAGDEPELSRLTEDNLRLVYSIAPKFAGRGAEHDDLVQLGSIGLVKAILKFDPSFGVKFSTYAVPMIVGEIKRHLRDDGPVKVSRALKTLASKAFSARERLSCSLCREPTVGEIAEELGEDPGELAAAMDSVRAPESLYASSSENEALLLMDKLSSEESFEAQSVDRLALSEQLRAMPERERKIIILRYFKDQTQSQIAAQLGISQVQVSRLEKKAIGILRAALTSER